MSSRTSRTTSRIASGTYAPRIIRWTLSARSATYQPLSPRRRAQ
jgi:hypothetical protein